MLSNQLHVRHHACNCRQYRFLSRCLEGFIRDNHSEYQLLDTACQVQELIQKTGHHRPNLVVTGADMPGISSAELCCRLLQQCSTVHIIGCTAGDMAYHARQMLRAGARGAYCLKMPVRRN